MPLTMTTILRQPARLALITCYGCYATSGIIFYSTLGYVVACEQVMPPNGYIYDVQKVQTLTL